MTGPEHYREAELLLDAVAKEAAQFEEATDAVDGFLGIAARMSAQMSVRWANTLAAAQAHATLALAAATGTRGSVERGGADRRRGDDDAWWEVTGP